MSAVFLKSFQRIIPSSTLIPLIAGYLVICFLMFVLGSPTQDKDSAKQLTKYPALP